MNREEREEYVIQLWKAGRTVRQIAELVHMSFRDIGAIIKATLCKSYSELAVEVFQEYVKKKEKKAK